MSRWRQTLCGSTIKSCEPYLEAQIIRFRDNAQTLTNGGSYLPQPYENSFKQKTAGPTMLMLPKDEYEVLVVDHKSDSNRYGGNDEWVHEVEAGESDELLETKLWK